ncbi:hypothetical protein ACPROK_14550 [Glutamicibacter soli]|uniref:hypothetical protein n=1 Tax=Glutamicibacter soli TaxID=453836 RepID=UPI003C7879FE
MSADQIYSANSRRMWRVWLPVIAVLVLALYFVLPLPNGLGLLTMLIFTATCSGAVVDWASSELRAHQALSATAGH